MKVTEEIPAPATAVAAVKPTRMTDYKKYREALPPAFNRVLETIGFEYVIHEYSENKQAPRDLGDDAGVKNEDADDVISDATANARESSPETDVNLNRKEKKVAEVLGKRAEMVGRKCRHCAKEFSSVFIAKIHEENEHSDTLPEQVVQKVGEFFCRVLVAARHVQFVQLRH